MKKRVFFALTVILLLAIVVLAYAEPYKCQKCGSTNVDSSSTQFTRIRYIDCTHYDYPNYNSNWKDKRIEYWYRVDDVCYSCNQSYSYFEYSHCKTVHHGTIQDNYNPDFPKDDLN